MPTAPLKSKSSKLIIILVVSALSSMFLLFLALKLQAQTDQTTEMYTQQMEQTSTTMIYVFLHNGLGDRMIDMSGALTIKALFPNIELDMNWSFGGTRDIFDTRLLMSIATSNDTRPRGVEHCNTVGGLTLSPYMIYMLRNRGDHMITSFKDVVNRYVASMQSIEILPQLMEFVPKEMHECVALHLRKSDKVYEKKEGDSLRPHETSVTEYHIILDRMMVWIDGQIKTGGFTSFFVCSEDLSHRDNYVQKLKDLGKKYNRDVKVYTISADDLPQTFRNTYKGAYTILEWCCLAQCRFILQGTKYSTFSMTAAMRAQSWLHNFADHDSASFLMAWKPCLKLKMHGKYYDRVVNEDEVRVVYDQVVPELKPITF
jgi:hypothetical protein